MNITKNLLVSLALLGTISAYAQTEEPESRVITDSISSNVLQATRHYNVYLPKSYFTDKDKTFPVLYLLHGLDGTNQDWSRRGHVKDVMDQLTASGEACDMVIIMPNAGGTPGVDWNGYFNMPGWNYEDFFFNELIPEVEKKYRIEGRKEKRALAGLSMGGGGTISYAQRHSELFSAAYAMSALTELPGGRVTEGSDKISLLNKSVSELNCVDYVRNADDNTKDALRDIKWFVDCGDDDFLFDVNINYVMAMKDARIPLEFRVRDGGHTWEYWHSALYTALPFVSRTFK